MAQVDLDIDDYLGEADSTLMILELKSRAHSLDSLDLKYLREVLYGDSLEESLKQEEWNEVKDSKTSMQWREHFHQMISFHTEK